MSLNIGDNFKYLGKKFLDNRESFNTLEEMNACNDVPKGFITICYENDKRYEFNGMEWVEYIVNNGDESSNINIDDVIYYGIDEPTNDDVIWFYPNNNDYQGINIDNAIIAELMSIIQNMQSQIIQLQADVEYLKTHGGGSVNPTPPSEDSIYSYLVLEDGSKLLLESGDGSLILEVQEQTVKSDFLVLEDGSKLLLESGDGSIILEQQQQTSPTGSYLKSEDGSKLLLETNDGILLEM